MQALDRNARTWGAWCHFAALAGFIGLPFGNILGPLIVWQLKREDHPFVDEQGRNALNYQISLVIYALISLVLCLVLIGVLLLGALYLMGVIFPIIAGIQANNGVSYRYPLAIEFIRPAPAPTAPPPASVIPTPPPARSPRPTPEEHHE